MGVIQCWLFTCDECGTKTYRQDSRLPKNWVRHHDGGLMCRCCAVRYKPRD